MATTPNQQPQRREPVTVYVDAGPFSYDRLTGLSRYTAQLTLALGAEAPIRFFSEGIEITPAADLNWSQDQDLAQWSREVWRGRRANLDPATIPARSVGLYCTLRPLHRTFPFEVSVLHDFSPYTVAWTHLESTRQMFGGFFGLALPKSDVAIAVSESTKADAAWLSTMDPDRVVVAPSGPSLCVGEHGFRKKVRRQQDIGLVVSTLEPRKNATFLFDWFLNSDAVAEGSELWWVGPLGWLNTKAEMKKFQNPAAKRQIKFLGVVSDAELCRLYRTATYSAYPSLYEGFGFPVLDSLRHHTPVLAAMNSSIREFESPGIFFFDPDDKATLDQAYCRCRAEGFGREIPQEPLDAAYSWRNVARTLLDQAAGHFGDRKAVASPGRAVRVDGPAQVGRPARLNPARVPGR